ncbi:MAG: S9 family peptidase [Pseudonocardiales bacterium]|nr:S9 family peptidase [Pseudonocardiales bacterium]MBV9031792.1 S9 family peptidase [Pseudonocardiales bacterium]
MTTVPAEAALITSGRINFVFSGNGRYGTSLRTSGEDVALESWTLVSEEARGQTIPDVVVDGGTHALPLDDGRVLLFQRGGVSPSGRHEITLLKPQGKDFSVERLGAIPSLLGGYLLPSPSSAQLGFVVALNPRYSTIWRLSASPPRIVHVAQVPGSLDGGVWLDGDARVLAVNQTCGSCRSNGITVDLAQGSWQTIWSRSVTSADRILLGSLRSKIIIVTTTVSGEERLGWARIGEPTVHFPDTLHRPGYERRALTLDDRGERLLVHEVAGAVSRLFIYTPAEDSLVPLTGPPGRISSPASWTGDLSRFPFSSPAQPPTLATVRLGAVPRWSLSRDHDVDGHIAAPQAELVELEGPAGPIEAIVYGGPDWRACEHLVVALHGGPLSSWHFGFEPLFHCLSAHGVAVVAPNYRGSTGYGEEHLRAVIGHWGGPDLDDVLHLSRSLNNGRRLHQLPRPVVLGVSYGAFLALLAACHAPESWSACVALAPFLSGPRFYDSANVAVRHRIEQLGGLRRIENGIGQRDVLQACAALSAPLLLMHGVADETIPVEQSRMLRRRLLELGMAEGVDFEYAEVDSDHGGLFQQKTLSRRVARFCLARSAHEQ